MLGSIVIDEVNLMVIVDRFEACNPARAPNFHHCQALNASMTSSGMMHDEIAGRCYGHE